MLIVRKVHQFIERQRIDLKSGIVVAVSTGVDSIVLAHALNELGGKLHVAHVHHGKRDESDEEETFVSNWCKLRQVPISIKRLKPTEKPVSANFQDWARKQRYAFFNKVAEEHNCDYIATAHHFDDKVETFVAHALRGSGINGLSSLREKEDNVIRPLLNVSRAEIEQYAEEQNLEWREDTSNVSDDYQRNRIRHHILPALHKVKENWRDGMANTFKNIAEEKKLLHAFIEEWKAIHVKAKDEQWAISISALKNTMSPKALLFHLLRHMDEGFDWNALANCSNDRVGSYYYGSSHRALRDREHLIIEPRPLEVIQPIKIDLQTSSIETPYELNFAVLEADHETAPKKGQATSAESFEPTDALLDFDKLIFPLTLRPWQQGDKLIPLGMKGMKLISDYLNDVKVPRNKKEKTLVLVSGNDIVWLVGHRIDERYKVGEHTQKMYLARLQKGLIRI